MEKAKEALSNHQKGYNCAQSIACAYSQMFGIDEKTAFRMAEGLGYGMGAMDACGAVTAMAMVAGMKLSDGDQSAPATKKICYEHVKEMIERFKEKNGTIICRVLRGEDTGTPLKSCDEYIEDAVIIIEEYLMKI